MYGKITKTAENVNICISMGRETISKSRVSPKNDRSRGHFLLTLALFILGSNYCFGQQVGIQQSQQNININLPVIEKTVYIDRYRTVYVDKPQTQRIAKTLAAPIQLLGYLWVYPEDLGNFKQPPLHVIEMLNKQEMHKHNNWRIPTPDELALLEANADKVGLGDDIYLATDHANGVLRLVAREETPDEKAERLGGVLVNGVIWSKINVGASEVGERGRYFSVAQNACPNGWRLPTRAEFNDLLNSGKMGYAPSDSNKKIIFPYTVFYSYNNYAWKYWTNDQDIQNNVKYNYIFYKRGEEKFEKVNTSEDYVCIRCVLNQ